MSESPPTPSSDLSPSPNRHLDDDVRARVEQLSRTTCLDWGGQWADGTAHVQPLDFGVDHTDKTVVRSVSDGRDAFRKYREFFEYVLETRDATADAAVLIPCGKEKPIGSSAIHQKKLDALRRAGLGPDDVDVVIVSEPCTIIPHDMRLSLPAVNYDFPPEYAEQETAPQVFDVFTDRIAHWMDERGYDTLYPYLVERHQNKFDHAFEKADVWPDVVEIPGASLNRENGSYSGDLFKSVEDMAAKIDLVRAFTDPTVERDELVGGYQDDVVEFYRGRYAP